MIEIQCTSCHTRYRIDERVLPDETPTFKCSRCGHVFNAEPLPQRPKKAASLRAVERASARPAPPRPEPPEEPTQAKPTESEDEPLNAAPEPPAPPQTAEEAAPAKPSTDDLLNRAFEQARADADEGENLSFDFSDEGEVARGEDSPAEELETAESEPAWQVGEPEEARASEPDETQPEAPHFLQPPQPEPRVRLSVPGREEPAIAHPQFASGAGPAARSFGADRAILPDDVAYISARGRTHASGAFLLSFFAVAVLFGAFSTFICGTPIASARALSGLPVIGSHFTRPIVPAMLVALHGVHAEYQAIKGGEHALVITGTAENVGARPLHAVLISVDLLDGAQRQLAGQAAYCGNGLSTKMIGEMTPREIEFLQRLDPQKSFVMQPAGSAPFALVFIKPPPAIARLRIEVSKAAAASVPEPPRT
jgi:predicted Zn finger-like uncharacterized protein